MRTLAVDFVASIAKQLWGAVTLVDMWQKINLYGIADSTNLQILGQKTSALQTYSLETLKAISEKGILLENGKLAPNIGKAFYADLIKPIGDYAGKATAQFGKVLEVAGFKGAGAALGAGFLVTGVANVVVAYKEGEQWNNAVQHAVVEGFAQAGQFAVGALVFGVGAALALSLGAPALLVTAVGVAFGGEGLVHELYSLQQRIERLNTVAAPPTLNAVTQDAYVSPPSTMAGVAQITIGQDSLQGGGGNDQLEAINAQAVYGNGGDDIIVVSLDESDPSAPTKTLVDAGDGNDVVIATDAVRVQAGNDNNVSVRNAA